MNQPPHNEIVYQVAAETLESLAMMFLVPEDEAATPPACSRRVRVAYSGPWEGSLVVAASDNLLAELATNMLGLEAGMVAAPAQQIDALKELANVICGNLLPAIAGGEPVFHICGPEMLAPGPGPVAPDQLLAGTARLLTDAGVLEVEFFAGQTAAV